MRRELARILREQPRTVVFVTHDIEEAAQLADRVLVLSERPARIRGELVLARAAAARRSRIPRSCAPCDRILTSSGSKQRTAERDAATALREVPNELDVSPLVRWSAGTLAFAGACWPLLRLQPWQRSVGAGRRRRRAGRGARRSRSASCR